LLLFVSEITGSEVNKRVDTVWHQWQCMLLDTSQWYP